MGVGMGSESLGAEKQEAPDAEAILRETQRRLEARRASRQPGVVRLQRAVYWLARHWVSLTNTVIALYLFGAILPAPLMHAGYTDAAALFYRFYRGFCHQYPFRSWFLFGEAAAYPLREPIPIIEMNRLRSFVGNAHLGYKLALCQRDIAIYSAMLIGGLAYGIVRRWRRIPPLPLWLYFAFGIMPMMLDGGIQWLSYAIWQLFPGVLSQPFETIPQLRTLTGALFGLGVIGLGYPYLGEYFDEVKQTLSKRYA